MFTLTLVTPEKRIVAGTEIEEVFVPAERGELNILPGHAPLMTTLNPGILRYRLKGDAKMNAVAISWGYCQVNPQGVNVLAETAERPEEIDKSRLETAFRTAQSRLSSSDLDSEAIVKYQQKLALAEVRKELVTISGNTTSH
jgi:F-type H+-transporting ATPase subunit epsilon